MFSLLCVILQYTVYIGITDVHYFIHSTCFLQELNMKLNWIFVICKLGKKSKFISQPYIGC